MTQILQVPAVRCVLEAQALVGECPRWHPTEHVLYWVDIYRPSLNRFDPTTGKNTSWVMPERIGCFAFRRSGGIIAGMQSGIYFVDIGNDIALRRVFEFEPNNPESRFNDGRCDPGGRFWAATLIETLDQRAGIMYRFDPDGSCRPMIGGLICPNGLAFSPNGRTLYQSDSRQDYVFAWDFDQQTGDISNQRVFLAMDIQEGRADGAAVDCEGYYWICHVGGWHVARYSPEGKIDCVIGVPVQRPTMCAFGGENLDVLFITTARFPLSEATLRKQPLAGNLFSIDIGIQGLPEPFFAA